MKLGTDSHLQRSSSRQSEWKFLQLGDHVSHDEIARTLEKRGFRITDRAADVLNKTVLALTRTQIEIVRVSPWQLGLAGDVKACTIYERAGECGFTTVPAEVGPQLRLQYPDQASGEHLLIGMNPVFSDGYPSIFAVSFEDGASMLDADCGYPGRYWDLDSIWVFAPKIISKNPQ